MNGPITDNRGSLDICQGINQMPYNIRKYITAGSWRQKQQKYITHMPDFLQKTNRLYTEKQGWLAFYKAYTLMFESAGKNKMIHQECYF